jgi:hypothetical protein
MMQATVSVQRDESGVVTLSFRLPSEKMALMLAA